MNSEPAYRNDHFVRKCIIFPHDSLVPQLVDGTVRAVISGDNKRIKYYNQTLDLADTYGDEYHKIRTQAFNLGRYGESPNRYLLHYNLSSKLPINRCLEGIVGYDRDRHGLRLFWRGDAVAVKFKTDDDVHIDCLDSDLAVMGRFEDWLRDIYRTRKLEEVLDFDEQDWTISQRLGRFSLRSILGSHPYWGKNWRQKEATFLNEANELRLCSGRSPLTTDSLYYTLSGMISRPLASLRPLITLKSHLRPILPPELERRIFELSARNHRRSALELVRVARRVHEWIEPILYETVILDWNFILDWNPWVSKNPPFDKFLESIQQRPAGFHAKYVKNLWLVAVKDIKPAMDILRACIGVEDLVIIFPERYTSIPLVQEQLTSPSLRRLMCSLGNISSSSNCLYPNLSNLTHLHLHDDAADWHEYTGWENLRSLTHLAFACRGLVPLTGVMNKIPTLRYVALGSYTVSSVPKEFSIIGIYNHVPVAEVCGINIVWLKDLTIQDWGRGMQRDYWEVVEREVARRREALVSV